MKMTESLSEMTPNGMLLDVCKIDKNILKKDALHKKIHQVVGKIITFKHMTLFVEL